MASSRRTIGTVHKLPLQERHNAAERTGAQVFIQNKSAVRLSIEKGHFAMVFPYYMIWSLDFHCLPYSEIHKKMNHSISS